VTNYDLSRIKTERLIKNISNEYRLALATHLDVRQQQHSALWLSRYALEYAERLKAGMDK